MAKKGIPSEVMTSLQIAPLPPNYSFPLPYLIARGQFTWFGFLEASCRIFLLSGEAGSLSSQVPCAELSKLIKIFAKFPSKSLVSINSELLVADETGFE